MFLPTIKKKKKKKSQELSNRIKGLKCHTQPAI